MVLLLFRGNILSSPFCQGLCVYFKTPIAAIHYIKRTGFTLKTTAQIMKKTADLVTFTEKTLNEKLRFLCSEHWNVTAFI